MRGVVLVVSGLAVVVAGLSGIGLGVAAADPPSKAPTATATTAVAASTTAPAASVSISDDLAAVRSGQTVAYSATVVNGGATDIQVLLEITVPDGAKVVDAGSGTMRGAVIDYGLTVLARGHVTQRFTAALGSIAADQQRIDAVASLFVLGTSNEASGVASVKATDSDTIAGRAAVGSDRAGASGAAGSTATGSPNKVLWSLALVLGVAMIGGGLLLAVRRAPTPESPELTASARRHVAPARHGGRIVRAAHPQAPAELPHPGRAARRAAQSASKAGIRTGSHQLQRRLP